MPPSTSFKPAELLHCISTQENMMMGIMISNMGPLYFKISTFVNQIFKIILNQIILYFVSGGSDANKLPIPDIFPGIENPLDSSDPSNQFRYLNSERRKSLINELNQKNQQRFLEIPNCLELS